MRGLVVSLFLVFVPMPALAQAQAFPDDAKILEIAKARVEDGRVKGIVIGLLDRDGARRIISYGDPGPGAKPLGADSVFEIGSITKVFTGTLLADMAARGEVKLDAPAQTYAPGGLVLPKRNGKEIALVHLSEQNSGLPRLPGNMQPANMANPYADYTVAQLHVFLSNYQLQRDPGEKFEYSNLGVGLLGHLLATRIGKSYEALVTERILKRLGMTSTAITLSPAMQANLVKGHDRSGNVVSNWDMPALAGAGALRSSMTDMLTFLDANLGEPKNDLERAMRLAQQPRAVADNMQIGLNWLTIPTPSGKVVAHDGGTGGYGAFIAMDPGRGIGVVVLANTAARTSSDIALHLLDPAAPLAPKPVAAEPKQRVAVDVPVEVLQRYVGEYVLDSISFTMKLTVEDGALVIHPQGQGSDRLFAESPTQFFSRTIDAQITMLTDASGAATGFTLHQSGANLPARKVR